MDIRKLMDAYGDHIGGILAGKLAFVSLPSRHCCPTDCARPCCRSPIPGGEMNLFEMMVLAAHLGLTPAAFFGKYIELGVDVVLRDGAVPVSDLYRISWHLKRPCPFLGEDGKCGVSCAQPLVCQLFPEAYFRLRRLLDADAESYIYSLAEEGYHCACDPSGSFDRQFLLDLQHRTVINAAISSCFFFEETPMVVDVSAYSGEIRTLTASDIRRENLDRGRSMTLSYAVEPSDRAVLNVLNRYRGERLKEEAVSRLRSLMDKENRERFFATFKILEQFFSRNFSSFSRYKMSSNDDGLIITATPLLPFVP